MVELKATTKIEDVNKAQLINYLEVYINKVESVFKNAKYSLIV